MHDFGRSDDAAVQLQLSRLAALSLPTGRLGLETIRALLARLGDPHKRLPPTFHVAGTNGKGSTCAFLRAMLETEGYRVHVTTSPHLVRYNERIRVAGKLIEDDRLAGLLEEVFDAGADLNPSFFEVTIAAAFTEFARVPADACVVEVGLGGRFDATNVLEPEVLAACGIAALGLDHERFLLAPEEGVPKEPMARIAFEKAGIAKPGVPLVTIAQPEMEMAAIRAVAGRVRAPVSVAGIASDLPLALPGTHQRANAGLAIAMLRAQSLLPIASQSIEAGMNEARWPARLQRVSPGPLTGTREVWLDGGHNLSAGQALAAHFAGQRLHLIIGMIEGKDPAALTGPLANYLASLSAVPVPTHDWHPAENFGNQAVQFPDVPSALAAIPNDGLPILIAGSLYLAGEVLRLNNELPD
ncbi:MAG: bifunctional folylpolyglutamate synthase/dihydrofolate synthase [Sphingomonadaceae bacterium]